MRHAVSCAARQSAFVVFVIAAVALPSAAQERDRSKIADKYTWNLADIYPNEAAWRSTKDKIAAELPEAQAFKGKLASSPRTLADALERMSALDKDVSRLYVYASLLSDQDTRDAGHHGMQQEMVQLSTSLDAQTSFVEPEILRFPKGTVEKFLAGEPRLEVYRFYLENIARRSPHTLGEDEERMLANLGPLAGNPSDVYGILTNADFPYPSVTLSDGRTVKIDLAAIRTAARTASTRTC